MTKPRKSNSGELRAALGRLVQALEQQRFPNGADYEPCSYSLNVTKALTEARATLTRGYARRTPAPAPGDVAPERKRAR